MVDKEQQEAVGTYGFWDNDTKAVPEYYIKAFTVNGDASDVTLLLGNTYQEQGLRVDLCKLRLVMTHRDFLDFAEEVRKEADLLKILYQGIRPGLDRSLEEINEALEEVYGNG